MAKQTHRNGRPLGQRAALMSDNTEGAFARGSEDIAGLKEEMQEWQESLESNNMEHLPKYDEVQEAVNALESASDTLEGIEFPECLSDVDVTWHEDTRKSATSRSARMSNAYNALDAAKCAAEILLETMTEPEEGDDEAEAAESDEDREARESNIEAVELFISDLESALGDLEGVSFPGMY